VNFHDMQHLHQYHMTRQCNTNTQEGSVASQQMAHCIKFQTFLSFRALFENDIRNENLNFFFQQHQEYFSFICSECANSCAFSADGAVLASASSEKAVRLWNVKTFMNVATLQGHTNVVNGCDISGDGVLASASYDNTVRLWDMSSQQCIAVLIGHTDVCNKCCFTAGGTLLASTSADNTVRLWDMRTRQSVATLKDANDFTYQCSFSSDGAWIAAGCSGDNVARVWDVKTLRCIATLQHDDDVYACSLSSNDMIATAGLGDDGSNQVVCLWQ